jgi:hypothetical protein
MAHTTSGHLLIADISGYTRYLTSSELEHAQQVLSSLMGLLVDRTLPPLHVAGLEGDAVFSYGIANGAPGGQTLVEMIETTYVAFRRAIDQMVMNTTCQCNACANISTLDLKFLVHYGTFSISPLRGRDELVGSAVIEVHRLLKNHITEATGVRAYAAYTSAAVDALGLDGFTENLTPHTETDPDLGELTVWVQDMHPLWENTRVDNRLRVDPADTLATVQGELPVPLAVAWELLLRPDCRSILFGSDRQDQSQLRHGRIAEGTVFTCYHGTSTVTTQTVLDLEPLHYLVTEDTTPIPGARMIGEVSLEPRGDATAITITSGTTQGPWLSRTVNNIVGRRMLTSLYRKGLATLRAQIQREIADGTLPIPERRERVATEVDPSAAGSPTTSNDDT